MGGIGGPTLTRRGVAAGFLTIAVVVGLGLAHAWPAEAWSAAAAWTTAGIALAAGLVAVGQLAEARELRREQAQPYVVVSMEPSRPGTASDTIDLVIKNLGKTAARQVRVAVDPTPVRGAGKEVTDLWLPDELTVLVPNQEWRTFWDRTDPREEVGLPRLHTAVVTYKDSQGQESKFTYALDWTPWFYRSALVTHDLHKGVETLQKIEKAIKTLDRDLKQD